MDQHQCFAVTRTLTIFFLFAAFGAWAFPPPQFSSGTFASGSLAVGSSNGSIPSGGGGAPGDGYEANLWAYYKMDENTSTVVADSAHSRHLGTSSGTLAENSVPGIIGNALDFGANGSGVFAGNLDIASFGTGGADADYDYFGHSFTFRFWVKTVGNGYNNNWLSGFGNFEILYGSPPFGVDGKIDFQLYGDVTTYDLVSSDIADGNWHRIILWYNASTFDTGIQVDNNSPTTQTTGPLFDPGTGQTLDICCVTDRLPNPPDPSWKMDEFAIWVDYVLTADDRTFDWNSGAGQTYPLP